VSLAGAAQPLARFDIGRVLGRSFATLGERWLTLAVLVLGLHFAVSLTVGLTVKTHYRPGSHDLPSFAAHVGVALGLILVRSVSAAAVVSASLTPRQNAARAVAAVLGVLPALLPVWLASEYATLWGFYDTWNGLSAGWIKTQRYEMVGLVALGSGLSGLVILLVSAAAAGVYSPVVLAERRGLAAAFVRAWRLLRGARWRMVALYAMVMTVLIVLAVVDAAVGASIRMSGQIALYHTFNWAMTAVMDCIGAFWSIIAASAYLELRRVKEGEPADEVAQVFA
jgi:hypothetical protein